MMQVCQHELDNQEKAPYDAGYTNDHLNVASPFHGRGYRLWSLGLCSLAKSFAAAAASGGGGGRVVVKFACFTAAVECHAMELVNDQGEVACHEGDACDGADPRRPLLWFEERIGDGEEEERIGRELGRVLEVEVRPTGVVV